MSAASLATSPRRSGHLRPSPVWLTVPAALWLVLFGLAPLLFMLAMSTCKSDFFGSTAT